MDDPPLESIQEDFATEFWIEWHYAGDSDGLKRYLALTNDPIDKCILLEEAISRYCSPSAIGVLVSSGLDLSQKMFFSESDASMEHPLVLALKNKKVYQEEYVEEMVEELLKHGADTLFIDWEMFDHPDIDKNSDAYWLVKNDRKRKVRHLHKVLALPDENGNWIK